MIGRLSQLPIFPNWANALHTDFETAQIASSPTECDSDEMPRYRCAEFVVALAILVGIPIVISAETLLFIVAESGSLCLHCDSFLLPLSDPGDIADARALIIAEPGGSVGSIPVLQIGVGSDGQNRDALASGEPLWSWHVTSFTGFADFTIELCDGWPGFIEQDPAAFIENTGGQFCPWSYTVVAELAPPTPVPSLSRGAALTLILCLSAVARCCRN